MADHTREDEEAPEVGELAFAGTRRTPAAWLEDRALAGALCCTARLPWRGVDAFLGGLARVAHAFSGSRNRAAREFLGAARDAGALGPGVDDAALERFVVDAYRHLFRVVVEADRVARRVPRERLLERVDLVLAPRVRELADRGEPVVMVTPHLGNWEVGSMVAAAIGFEPFAAIAKPAKNHFVSLRIMRSRRARGIRVLPRRGAMAEAPRLVREGTTLALLLDQRARTKPVLAPFFGRPARCDRSAGVLIRRLGVPLVVAGCYRGERPLTFEFRAEDVLEPEELARMNPLAVATRLNGVFERMIRRAPQQYFWLHDRYRDAPPPDAELPADPTAGEGRPAGD